MNAQLSDALRTRGAMLLAAQVVGEKDEWRGKPMDEVLRFVNGQRDADRQSYADVRADTVVRSNFLIAALHSVYPIITV